MTKTYNEVIEIIQNTRRFGKQTGYEVSTEMLEKLGNPQNGIPFVHIAGTNGKGSTTAFLSSILQQAGWKVGMFTSPHLVAFEERIRVNGNCIEKADVERLGNKLLAMDFAVSPTMFDYCLAMAVLYFAEQKCDIMLMETGIGGRYDSTNALGVPEVSVITRIGMDHTELLGDTLEQITMEKAGIIKKDTAMIIALQEPSVMEMLREEYEKINGSDELCFEVLPEDIEEAAEMQMQMRGEYQYENAATAILAAKWIFAKWEREGKVAFHLVQKETILREGIAEAVWKGRMELVNEDPFFLIDGAHNGNGVHALAISLKKAYPDEKFHFIMGVMADKDYENMIEELLPIAQDFVTVTPESERALQAEELAACIRKKGIQAEYAEQMEDVIAAYLPETAGNTKTEKPMTDGAKTVAFGSLYFIGAIEAMLENRL